MLNLGDLEPDREDDDVDFLPDEADGRDSDGLSPWNTDEEVLREFHRAVTHRASRSLSGRML